MSDELKTRKITLTDRGPVKINEPEWPVLAKGSYFDHDGQVVQQSNRRTSVKIIVRCHADGRALIYGIYDYDSNFQHESGATYRRGVLLTEANETSIIAAVRAVRDEMVEALGSDERDDARHVRAVAQECIADLPVEAI